jgi:hypothetical protein
MAQAWSLRRHLSKWNIAATFGVLVAPIRLLHIRHREAEASRVPLSSATA